MNIMSMMIIILTRTTLYCVVTVIIFIILKLVNLVFFGYMHKYITVLMLSAQVLATVEMSFC